MMMGVVIIHCNVVGLPGYDGPSILTESINFFTSKFTSVRVPWFFFISAYLMGHRHPDIDGPSYKSLIYKRVKSILVPYLLWNTIAFLLRAAVNISPLGKFAQGLQHFDSPADMLISVYIVPELVPLWFLRDLFLFALVAPVIQRLVRFNALVALVVLWLVDQYTFTGGILFYGLGFVCAERFSPDRLDSWLPKFAILLPVVCLLMYVEDRYFNNIPFVREILIACGMFGVWGAACSLIPSTGAIGRPDNLFFIYAFLGIISPYVLKSLNLLFTFSGYSWLICYIATIIIVVAVAYGAAVMTKTISPRSFAILTGSRHRKLNPL